MVLLTDLYYSKRQEEIHSEQTRLILSTRGNKKALHYARSFCDTPTKTISQFNHGITRMSKMIITLMTILLIAASCCSAAPTPVVLWHGMVKSISFVLSIFIYICFHPLSLLSLILSRCCLCLCLCIWPRVTQRLLYFQWSL